MDNTPRLRQRLYYRRGNPVRLSRLLVAWVMATGTLLASWSTPSPAGAVSGYTISGGPWNVRSCSSTVCPVVDTISNGAIPDLTCQTYGEVVTFGSDASSIWDRVRTPRGTVGYLTDLAVVESWYSFDPRIPRCTGNQSASVYYQPRFNAGDPVPPSTVIPRDRWSNGDCIPRSAYSFPGFVGDRRVTTLAGWSLGRLGPTYLLYWFFERSREINSIVLFDPGSYDDYFGEGSCDLSYDQSELYSRWLSLSPDNRLLILAGEVTKDQKTAVGPIAHRGIQEALFPKIRGTALSSQVLVCNYDALDHPAVLREFAGVETMGPRSTCPEKPGIRLYDKWHP